MALLRHLGWLALALLLYAGAVVLYETLDQGPWTPAAHAEEVMAKAAARDLAHTGLRLEEFRRLFGEPERVEPDARVTNATRLRWLRGALIGVVVDGELVQLLVRGEDRPWPPYWGMSVYRGPVFGLRLGEEAPGTRPPPRIDGHDAKWHQDAAGRRLQVVERCPARPQPCEERLLRRYEATWVLSAQGIGEISVLNLQFRYERDGRR